MYIWYVCVIYIIFFGLSNGGFLLGWFYVMVWFLDRRCFEGFCKEREKEYIVGFYCFYFWLYWDILWVGYRVCGGGCIWGEIISLLVICFIDLFLFSDWLILVSGWLVS